MFWVWFSWRPENWIVCKNKIVWYIYIYACVFVCVESWITFCVYVFLKHLLCVWGTAHLCITAGGMALLVPLMSRRITWPAVLSLRLIILEEVTQPLLKMTGCRWPADLGVCMCVCECVCGGPWHPQCCPLTHVVRGLLSRWSEACCESPPNLILSQRPKKQANI